MPVLEIVIAVFIVALLLGGLALCGSRLLLGWYLHEVRREEIAQEPGEAIITYPLA